MNIFGSISINGSKYSGKNIRIENNKVYVDGNLVEGGKDDKVINILVEGSIDRLDVDYCSNLVVEGDVKTLNTVSADVKVNNVTGDIKTTSGDVDVKGSCGGSVNTVSGDVTAKSIAGNVKTVSGDIDR
jgi:hypothetical protein